MARKRTTRRNDPPANTLTTESIKAPEPPESVQPEEAPPEEAPAITEEIQAEELVKEEPSSEQAEAPKEEPIQEEVPAPVELEKTNEAEEPMPSEVKMRNDVTEALESILPVVQQGEDMSHKRTGRQEGDLTHKVYLVNQHHANHKIEVPLPNGHVYVIQLKGGQAMIPEVVVNVIRSSAALAKRLVVM